MIHRAHENTIDTLDTIDTLAGKSFEAGADGRKHPSSILHVDDTASVTQRNFTADPIRFVPQYHNNRVGPRSSELLYQVPEKSAPLKRQ
jgi:hypothetical protein